ncbi:hypothetical protein GCM10028827_19250 [Mucilaginibacter myungsuensis]
MGMIKTTSAQKLPNVQQKPLRAPANLKIDGKPNEWEGRLRSRDTSANFVYTISNDNDNLYLVLQTVDLTTVNKIMGGGISFTIQKSGAKVSNGAMVINYPVYKEHHPMLQSSKKARPKPMLSATQADSAMQQNNIEINAQANSIRLVGLKNMADEVPLDNELGVKAAQLFNTKGVYTCEIAVPLKALEMTTADAKKFSYQIALNVGPNRYEGYYFKFDAPASNATIADLNRYKLMQEAYDKANAVMYAATDLWGEYTLEK